MGVSNADYAGYDGTIYNSWTPSRHVNVLQVDADLASRSRPGEGLHVFPRASSSSLSRVPARSGHSVIYSKMSYLRGRKKNRYITARPLPLFYRKGGSPSPP